MFYNPTDHLHHLLSKGHNGLLHPRLRTTKPLKSDEKIIGQYSYPGRDSINITLPTRHPLHSNPSFNSLLKCSVCPLWWCHSITSSVVFSFLTSWSPRHEKILSPLSHQSQRKVSPPLDVLLNFFKKRQEALYYQTSIVTRALIHTRSTIRVWEGKEHTTKRIQWPRRDSSVPGSCSWMA